MKLVELYNLVVEEEKEKIDLNTAIKRGYYTVKGEDPETGREVDYVMNITGFKKYNKPFSELYDSIKFYKEADVPDNIQKQAISIMAQINKLKRDISQFESTVYVYQKTI